MLWLDDLAHIFRPPLQGLQSGGPRRVSPQTARARPSTPSPSCSWTPRVQSMTLGTSMTRRRCQASKSSLPVCRPPSKGHRHRLVPKAWLTKTKTESPFFTVSSKKKSRTQSGLKRGQPPPRCVAYLEVSHTRSRPRVLSLTTVLPTKHGRDHHGRTPLSGTPNDRTRVYRVLALYLRTGGGLPPRTGQCFVLGCLRFLCPD